MGYQSNKVTLVSSHSISVTMPVTTLKEVMPMPVDLQNKCRHLLDLASDLGKDYALVVVLIPYSSTMFDAESPICWVIFPVCWLI